MLVVIGHHVNIGGDVFIRFQFIPINSACRLQESVYMQFENTRCKQCSFIQSHCLCNNIQDIPNVQDELLPYWCLMDETLPPDKKSAFLNIDEALMCKNWAKLYLMPHD